MKYSSCAAFSLCVSITASAATITIPVAADTSLYESFPDNNYGASEHIAAGTTTGLQRTRALIRFDLSAIPGGSTVTDVRLNISVTTNPGGPASIFELHRMLQSWVEGTKKSPAGFPPGNGAAATAGEPTWNRRSAPSTSWTIAGGLADAAATASSSVSMNNPGGYEFPNSPALISDVQGWLSNPSSNFGWMMISTSESTSQTARRFGSKESTAPPSLVVTYTPPGELRITDIQVSNGNANLTWSGSRAPYRIERASNILGPWTSFPNTSETLGSAPLNGPINFFRVAGEAP